MKYIYLMLCSFLLFSCELLHNSSSAKDNTAVLNLFNDSSFTVKIYKNINPSETDTSTMPVAVIPHGQIKKIILPPTNDNSIGDVFYIRYVVTLADALESGVGKTLTISAKRNLSNITLFLEKDKIYSRTISKPESGSLEFDNGYIKLINSTNDTIQLLDGIAMQIPLGTQDVHIASGEIRYFEFSKNTKNNLKINNEDTTTAIQPFTLESGFLYELEYKKTETVYNNKKAIQY